MSSKDQQQFLHEGAFHQNSPRPPVSGEEKSHFLSDWGPETIKQRYMEDAKLFTKPSSPIPKRNFSLSSRPSTSLDVASSSSSRPSSRPADLAVGSRSPPSCLRWAHSLHTLLQDGDGVKLFRQYLESEGKQHSDALDFWFACEGLRNQRGVDKIMQLVKLIYKKYIIKSALPVPEEVRKEIGKIVKSSQCLDPPVTLFDKVQAQIEHLVVTTTYPNFLKSEMYLQYVENMQSSSSSGSSSDFSNDLSNMASALDPLPTVHEDMELVVKPPVHMGHPSGSMSTGYHTPNVAPPPMRLTKDLLLISQKRRSGDRSKSETFASMFVYRGGTGAHAAYNSYNPVSRQDSELHSLSSHSDVRTESDNLSLTDSSIDGRSMGIRTSRRQATLNREVHMNQIVIPRTQWVDKSQCQPMDTHKFASMLIEKLEIVKKDRDTQELLEKKLTKGESLPMNDANIRDKLLLDDENDQSILDDHVSLVFPDLPAGITSPGIMSSQKYRQPRRKKDGSIFSNDSGNVHDFTEGSEHKLGMVKSKSMPDYPDDRFVRGSVGRRSASKKTLTDLTDSGVSVVSDAPPAMVKDGRVLAWLMSGHNDVSVKRNSSYRTSSATSPISNRHKKALGSRSSSVERNSVTNSNLGPAQPFGDVCKAPLSVPNTLEEARRRLEDDFRTRTKARSSSNRHYPDVIAQSSQSTLRKSQRTARPSLPAATQQTDEVTTVVFTFCDEEFPYRTKIPGTQNTLKQFKEVLPKRGNYRFFFKTVCEELGDQVIHEEVSNDGDIVPLWEGKIMAQVKPVD
ncbi:axin isoform X1 [Euwallacea fornicatus]|uniref:axin isoform X1 n=1 Tax=Euwallacea fornicatus TaxID=995702 RepID=UPI00338DB3F2